MGALSLCAKRNSAVVHCGSWKRSTPARRTAPKGRTIGSMCWTLLTLGLSTGAVVLWRGGSTHNQRLEISGVLLLVAAVIVGAYYG
jgi:hypothetical protein